MLDTVFHTGLDHPNVLWIVVPALLSFAAGTGLGRLTADSTDPDPTDETTPGRE